MGLFKFERVDSSSLKHVFDKREMPVDSCIFCISRDPSNP
jgi:hypothetical protein